MYDNQTVDLTGKIMVTEVKDQEVNNLPLIIVRGTDRQSGFVWSVVAGTYQVALAESMLHARACLGSVGETHRSFRGRTGYADGNHCQD